MNKFIKEAILYGILSVVCVFMGPTFFNVNSDMYLIIGVGFYIGFGFSAVLTVVNIVKFIKERMEKDEELF